MLRPELIARLAAPDWRYAITGASGWLGRNALDLLHRVLGPRRFARDVAGYASGARDIRLIDGSVMSLRPLAAMVDEPRPDAILHLAFVMRERIPDLGVDAYVAANAAIADTVETAIRRHRPAALFLASSGAAYRPGASGTGLYGALKQRDEIRFRALMREQGGRFVAARIFNVTGRHAPRGTYALSAFAAQAQAGGRIAITARAPTRRSFVAATDLIAVALAELHGDATGHRLFDAATEPVELGALADLVRRATGRPDLPIQRSFDPQAEPDDYLGDPAAFVALAARHGVAIDDLETQVRAFIADYG